MERGVKEQEAGYIEMMEYWSDGMEVLMRVTGYAFRVTGSMMFSLIHPQIETATGFIYPCDC